MFLYVIIFIYEYVFFLFAINDLSANNYLRLSASRYLVLIIYLDEAYAKREG